MTDKISRRRFMWAAVGGSTALLTGTLLWQVEDSLKPKDKPVVPLPKKESPPFRGAVGQDQINELYVQIREGLRPQVEQLKKTGAKPLVVMGEDHEGKKSVLLEMLFIRALNELDPKGAGHGLVAEITQREYKEVITPNDRLPPRGIPGKTASSIYAKHQLKMDVTPVDDDTIVAAVDKLRQQGKEDEAEAFLHKTLESRDKIIGKAAHDALPEGGVVIVGLMHLRGVIKAFKEHDPNAAVMAVNVSVVEEAAALREGSHPYAQDSVRFATSSPMVNQMKLNGEVTIPINAMPSMIEAAVKAAPETLKRLQVAADKKAAEAGR